MDIFETILNAENIRVAIILLAVFGMAIWLNAKSDAKNAALQEKLTEKIDAVRAELTEKIERVRDELTGKIEAVRTELTNKIEAVRNELTGKIEAVRTELTGKIEKVQDAVAEIKNNDLVHLNQAFKVLSFILKQKGTITPEEQEHIDKSLKE